MIPRLALLATTLVWGATFPATKAALGQIPPLSFLFLRFGLGAVVAIAAARLCGYRLECNWVVFRMSLIATGWLWLAYVCQTIGLEYTTASNSAFITVLYVVFVPIILLRFGATTWTAIALAVLGLWLLVRPSASMNVGDLLNLACAAAFAGHIACLERYTRVGQSVSLLLWQMILTTVAMGAASIWERPPAQAFEPTPVLLVSLTVTGVLATGAFAVQMWVQRIVPAQQVALIFALEPACAAWLAWTFLDESLDARGWIGSACIFAATLVGTLSRGEAHGEPTRSLTNT